MHQNERHTWHNADGRASFGDLLRRLRAARGLSQEELAQRAGLSAHGISDLERGARTRPYPDTVRRLAFALHLTEEARVEFHSFARGAGLANAPGTAPEQPLSHRPEPLTSFIGRARELEQVADLLAREESPARLVTLVGPAGVGKTRLAIGTVGNLGPKYAGRTWFVPLASIRDPLLVPQAIAQELGLRESTHEGLVERVIRYLGAAPGLLVLDNFEQILAAATLVRRLLSECSELSILITSRAPLRLYGEHEFLVPALAVPDRSGDPGVERLSQVEAVRLFLERTQAVHSGLSLTEETAPVVAEICRRLEGLPLAIELAAARTKVLSPHALLARLGDQLSLLTTGSADLPVRQRTLRATLDWSYELLSPGQQHWFRRLSVFAGGCRLETAEAVCADQEGADALDALSALVDQSLLYVEYDADGEPRFQMLEFVHEFAWERLLASPEFRLMRERHAHEFVRLAEEADSELRGPGQSGWRDRLQRELPNLRAALRWVGR